MVESSSVQSLSHVQLFATHGLQHAKLPCPSPTPRVYSSSCPSSRWCHLTISSSVIPFSSCLQFFPASGSFQMSQLFSSGGQSIGVSASASVLPMNIQDWFPLGLTGWISLLSKGLKSLLQHHSFKASILWRSAFFIVQLSHPYMTIGKIIALIRWTFVDNVSAFWYAVWVGHSFSSKEQASFNFMAAVTICNDFGAQENKVYHWFHCFPIYLPWSDGTRCHDLSFLNVEF